jgi:hypothetical protein
MEPLVVAMVRFARSFRSVFGASFRTSSRPVAL